MSSYSIPDPETLDREIKRSHARSRQYNIDPLQTCNPDQVRLTGRQLIDRRQAIDGFLKVVITQIEEVYYLVAGSGFMVGVVDAEGYLLETIGDPPILEKLAWCTPTPWAWL